MNTPPNSVPSNPVPNTPTPSDTRRNLTAPLTALGVCAVVVLGIWLAKRPGAPTPAASEEAAPVIKVQIAAAKLGLAETKVSVQGLLAPSTGASARVAVAVVGRLKSVLVREGERVQRGQLIALLDNTAQASSQNAAQAAVEGALADERSADLAVASEQTSQNNAIKNALATLRSAVTSRNADIANAKNALAQAQSDLRKTRLGAAAFDLDNAVVTARLAVRTAQASRDSDTLTARNALAQTQTELKKLQNGAQPLEIETAQAALSQAQATRSRAQKELDRVTYLESKGIRAKRDVEDAQTALTVADAGVQSAQNALDLLRQGTRKEDLQAASLRVQSAQDALAAAQSAGDAKVKQEQANLDLALGSQSQGKRGRSQDVQSAILKVTAARSAIEQAQKAGDERVNVARLALELAQNGAQTVAVKRADAQSKRAAVKGRLAEAKGAQIQTQLAQVRAPISGIVAKRNLSGGEIADPSQPIVEILNETHLVLNAKVPPEAGAQIKPGQSAILVSDSPHQKLSGQVLSVGAIAPTSNLQNVQIAVLSPSSDLRSGSFATGQILVSRRPLAVLIPKTAVLTRDGKSMVLLDKNGTATEAEVETGETVGANLEIWSGLKPGQKVVVSDQYELEDGSKIEVGGT